MRVSITVYGTAVPAGSKTMGVTQQGRRFVRDSSGHRGEYWRRDVGQAAGAIMSGRPLLEGPLCLVVNFHVPRPKAHIGARGLKPSAPPFPTGRPDTTKLVRAVEDALTGIVWRDDSQVVSQLATKKYGEPARCEIRVWHVDEQTEAITTAA